MRAPGIIAQEWIKSKAPPLNPGRVVDFDGFPVPTVSLPGALFANPVVDLDAFYAPTIVGYNPVAVLAPDLYLGASDVFYAASVLALGPGYFFDPATAFDVQLSNYALTATHSRSANFAGVKGISAQTAGKYYHEVVVEASNGANDSIGLSHPTTTEAQMAATQNSISIDRSGNIWLNGVNSGHPLTALVAGDVVGIAVDLTSGSQQAWFRKNGGAWVGGGNNPNPVSGQSGIVLPSGLSWMPFVGFSGAGTTATDNFTAQFGQSPLGYGVPYQTARPIGFTDWPVAIPYLTGPHPNLFIDADTIRSPTVVPGAVTVLPARVQDIDVFFTPPTIAVAPPQTITPFAAVLEVDVFFAPHIFVAVGPALFSDADSFYTATFTGVPAPRFVNAGTHASAISGTDTTFGGLNATLPASIVAGNLLLSFVLVSGRASTTFSISSGWTIGDQVCLGATFADATAMAWAWKIATSSETQPVWSWTTGNAQWHMQNWQVTNNDPTSPIGATAHNSAQTSTAFNVSGLTTTLDNSLVEGLMGTYSNQAMPMPAGYSARFALNDSSGSDRGVDQSLAASGATSANLAATLTSTTWIGMLFEIKRAGTTVAGALNPSLVTASDTFYAPSISVPVTYATFDGVNTSVAMSNGNLTVTHNVSAIGGARSTMQKNSGKWYFEITKTVDTYPNPMIGLLTASGTYTDFENWTNSVGVRSFNNPNYDDIMTGGASVGKNLHGTSAPTLPFTVGFAVDLDNERFWARVAPSGNWNGDATANPATNTGGVNIGALASTTVSPAVAFWTSSSEVFTANFGASAFNGAVPSGFNSGWY
jgi:hypothetical protein